MVEGKGWEIVGFNEGAQGIALTGFLMRFYTDIKSGYNPREDHKLFMCVQREGDILKNYLVIIVQDSKQYIIDILEMDRKIAQEESTILDN